VTPSPLNDSNHLPLPGVDADWDGIPQLIRASWLDGAEAQINDPDFTRSGHFSRVPELESILNCTGGASYGVADGEKFLRMAGSISMRCRVPQIGDKSVYADHLAHPFFRILNSLLDILVPTGDSDVLAAGVHTKNTFVPTDNTKYVLGGVIALSINNRVEFTAVTKIEAALITVSPAFEEIPSDGDLIRLCTTFFPRAGNTQPEIDIRYDWRTRRYYAFRCRLSELNFSFEGDSLYADMMISPSVIIPDHAAASVPSWTPSGAPAINRRQSAWALGAPVSGGVVPGALASQQLSLTDWSAKISGALAPIVSPDLVGASDVDIGFTPCELTLQHSTNADLEDMLRLAEERQVVVGAGPGCEGTGMGLVFTGHPTTRSKEGETDQMMELMTTVLRSGRWELDDGAGDGANKSWKLGFPI